MDEAMLAALSPGCLTVILEQLGTYKMDLLSQTDTETTRHEIAKV